MVPTVVVLYYTRYVYPLRNTISSHLYSWRKYGGFRYIYVNVAFDVPENLLKNIQIDAVIYHTSFLSARWTRSIFEAVVDKVSFLDQRDCLKIAYPQDEFLECDLLSNYLNHIDVACVMSASSAGHASIYRNLNQKVRIKTVLTGYIDEVDVRRMQFFNKIWGERSVDVGYRAWHASYWLGALGQMKVNLAKVFQAKLEGHMRLVQDISTSENDALNGDDWFRFLGNCKVALGTTGGSSIFDPTGDVRHAVDSYLELHPSASFEEVEDCVFKGKDYTLDMGHRVTPRHFEYCLAGCVPCLTKGEYNGIFQENIHYIPISEDFSDVEATIEKIQDPDLVNFIKENCWRDIVCSGKYSYRVLVSDFEAYVSSQLDIGSNYLSRVKSSFVGEYINYYDSLNWRQIKKEVSQSD